MDSNLGWLDGLNKLPGFNLLFGGGGPGAGHGSPAHGQVSHKHLDVTYLHDRVVAIGKPWDRRTEIDARRNNVTELGRWLEEKHGDRFLVLNLSSGANKFDYYKLKYQVIECDLETHPTLDSLFVLCHAVKLWLDRHEENVVCVFCNNGIYTTRIFVSTFLTFLGRFPDTHRALEYFYDRRLAWKIDAARIFSKAPPSLGHFLDGFQSILDNKGVPNAQPLTLCMLLVDRMPHITDKTVVEQNLFSIFGPAEEDLERAVQPIIRIYQSQGDKRRMMVYSSLSDPESCMHWCVRDGKLIIKCECEVLGDVEIDCVFPGNTNKFVFKFHFHTSFVERNGVVSVGRKQVDTMYRRVFHEDFKMDMVVQPAKGDATDVFGMMRDSVRDAEALSALIKMHFLDPDPALVSQLEAKGFSEVDARFMLQRTNNSLCEAEFLLGGRSPPPSSMLRKALQSPLREADTSPATILSSPYSDSLELPPEYQDILDEIDKECGDFSVEYESFSADVQQMLDDADRDCFNISKDLEKSIEEAKARKKEANLLESKASSDETTARTPLSKRKKTSLFLRRLNAQADDDTVAEAHPDAPSQQEVPFINNEEMTSELVHMLDELAKRTPTKPAGSKSTTALEQKQAPQTQEASSPKVDPREAMLKMLAQRKGKAAAPSSRQAEVVPAESPVKRSSSVDKEKANSDLPATYKRFQTMLKVGVPPGAVASKLAEEGLDPVPLLGDAYKTAAPNSDGAERPQEVPPEYVKFQKMLKMGVPEGAVITKMEAESMDPQVLGLGADATGGATASGKTLTKSKKARRKKIHWEAIPKDRLKEDSIWNVSKKLPKFKRGDRRSSISSTASNESSALLSPSRLISDELDPDMKELEALFVEQEADKNLAEAKTKQSKRTKIALLDAKRSQNVSIGLKKLKLDWDVLCDALNEYNGDVLTFERLQVIASGQMYPSSEEEKRLGSFRGDLAQLGDAERFFRLMASKVRQPKTRVEALLFCGEFQDRFDELKAQIGVVESACHKVRDSQSLQKLFQVVLLIGNKINAEGNNSIQGFTVASLLKLSQTKSFNRSTTILDFIASFAMKRIPEVMRVHEELAVLVDAKRFQLAAFEQEESSLHLGYQAVLRGIKNAERELLEIEDEEGKRKVGLDNLRAYSRNVQQQLHLLEQTIATLRQDYAGLLEFFCEDSRLPMHDFFATLSTFLSGFDKACRAHTEKQVRQARQKARDQEKAERKKSAHKRSKSASYSVKATPAQDPAHTPDTKWASTRGPRSRASSDENQASAGNQGGSSFQGGPNRPRPLADTPNLSRFLQSRR